MRDRAWRRKMKYKKNKRKKELTKSLLPYEWDKKGFDKVSFSSPYKKTNNKKPNKRKKYGNYAPSYNPPARDRRKIDDEILRNLIYDMTD